MTTKRRSPAARFALCVKSDDPDLLTPSMVYEVLSDDSAARSGYLRVVDSEGEDYLYPASWLVAVDLPPASERAIMG